MPRRLGAGFYARDATTVARELLGCRLVVVAADGTQRAGRIVETEAYLGPEDRACHARSGLTPRTRTLLGPSGHAYVFRIYGMYDCFNVVCGGRGQRGHAVLVRGVEPLVGVTDGVRGDGPGRAARALAIGRELDGASLAGPSVFVERGRSVARVEITARVGVAYAGEHADWPLRFYDAESRHRSRPARRTVGRGLA